MRRKILGFGALAVVAACATLPPTGRPRFVEEHVEAVYPAPPDGRVAVPQSTELLTVFALTSEPPPLGEEFPPQGGRLLLVPPAAGVVVRCRYRAYADGNGLLPDPAALFPGARQVRRLP